LTHTYLYLIFSMKRFRVVFYAVLVTLLCCKKPYDPPASSTPNSYLVVEGVFNFSHDSTVIKVSRTVNLNSKTTFNPVLGAVVTIEGEQNGSAVLYDYSNSGRYYNNDLNFYLSAAQRFRLRIVDGSKVYLSDFVEVTKTPPIDSVGYNIQNGVLNMYVNTQDPTNNSKYYRWDYQETWLFHAKYASSFVLDPNVNAIVPRGPYQQVYYCYGNDVSPHIILNSTDKLAKNVLYQSPITQIPLTSEKIESKYSILVSQYAVTQDAFRFYQTLEKNTEQLGSIFAVQPSELTGNIHCTSNPTELVLGYITATNVQTKRIYILQENLPDVQPLYPYDCQQDTALYMDKLGTNEVQNTLINPPIDYIPTSAIYASGVPVIIGYLYSTIQCTDCTIRGSTYPPSWWQ
jgi:hypothetical protein